MVPTKNGKPWIAQMLASIAGQQTRHHVEVLIIDSGSGDGTLKEARLAGARVVSIPPEAFGHGKTRNLGANLAEGQIIVYLSQDAVPASDSWLDSLVAPLDSLGVAAAYGRQLPNPNASPFMRFLHDTFYPNRGIRRSSGDNDSFSFSQILFSNVNSAIKKDVLLKNPFAEELLMSEDQEFAIRILGKGWTIVYEPLAAVWHSNEYNLSQFFRRNFDSAYSLRGIQADGILTRTKAGLEYLLLEIGYLARSGYWTYIPAAVCWEALRALSFLAGSNADALPSGIRRKLSQRPEFWADGTHTSAPISSP